MKLRKHTVNLRWIAAGLFVALFAAVGTYLLFSGHADIPADQIEAEYGKVSGNGSLITDSAASGGLAMAFGVGYQNLGLPPPPADPTLQTKPATLFVNPTGTGSDCTRADPCHKVDQALAVATSGSVIELQAGIYPAEKLVSSNAANFTVPVIIRGANHGAGVILGTDTTGGQGSWGVGLPNIVLTGLTFRNISIYLYYSASHVLIDGVHTKGAGMLVRDGNITIRNSLVEGDYQCSSKVDCGHDGLQIATQYGSSPLATNILIENNTVRDFSEGTSVNGNHSDCIQLFDVDTVIIRGNRLYNCYNTSIIFSPGANRGINNVTIESNFIGGCLPSAVARCNGGGLDTGGHGYILIRNNTVVSGYLRRDGATVVEQNNIFRYVSACFKDGGHNLIVGWNHGLCSSFPLGDGSKIGTLPAMVDYNNDDLHIVGDRSDVRFGLSSAVPATDIDGQAWCATPSVGADDGDCGQ